MSSRSSPIRKSKALKALALVFTLLSITILGQGLIMIPADGATVSEDPFHIKAAPHFRDVIYSLSEPTYLQRFDGLGKWKVSAGSPTVGGLDDSTLTITSPSTVLCELTLAKADAAGMNGSDDRTYVQARMATSSATAYVNITLEQVSTGYVAVISLHGGLITYSTDITSGGKANGTLYATAALSTYYQVAFDLAPVGITFYASSGTGVPLGNHYVNNARMGAGDVSEMHMSVSAASAKGTWDYVYVTDESPMAMESTGDVAIDPLAPDASVSHSSVKMDPTQMKIIRSGSSDVSDAFGIPSSTDVTGVGTLYAASGKSYESSQRIQGKQYAEGWNDFRSDTESQLKGVIASDKGVTSDDVCLIDYFIDYIQQQTTFDQNMVTLQKQMYEALFKEALKSEGIDITGSRASIDAGGQLSLGIMPPYAYGHMDLFNDFISVVSPAKWVYDATIGKTTQGMKESFDNVVNKIPTTADIEGWANRTMGKIDDTIDGLVQTGLNETEAIAQMLNNTVSGFSKSMSATITTMTAQTNELVANVSQGWADRFQDLNNLTGDFMTWSQKQSEVTNAMFSQMFLSMQDQMAETQRMFAGTVSSTNQAIMNLTSGITGGALQDVLSGGKTAEGTPWTISGIFGSGWSSSTVWIIVIVSIAIVMVLAVFVIMKSKRKRPGH